VSFDKFQVVRWSEVCMKLIAEQSVSGRAAGLGLFKLAFVVACGNMMI